MISSVIHFVFIRCLCLCLQHIGLLITSFLNTLVSAACCTGLLLAISITVVNNGQGLMLGCNDTGVPINARSPVSAKCPFDSTRIYVSTNLTFSPILPISLRWGSKFNKSITGETFNLILLYYFTLFLPRLHHFLSPRKPRWRCGSLVLCCQRLRLDCLSGASSLDWLSEGWHPAGDA